LEVLKMVKKILYLFVSFSIVLSMLSCSSSSNSTIIIDGDDLIGDVSNGTAFVGTAINNYGEWVAAGSKGIGYGSGSETNFNLIPMFTGDTDADRSVDINDKGNFVAAFQDGFYFGDTAGNLTQILEGNLGRFISAKINNNDMWVVTFEGGAYIGYGTGEPASLDFVSNIGAFSHVSVNNRDEFVIAGDIQVLYGYVDEEGFVNLFNYQPVSIFSDSVWTDINEYGDFIATGSLDTILALSGTKQKADYIFQNKRKNTNKKIANNNVSERKIDIAKFEKKGKLKVKYNYTPYYSTKGTQKVFAKAVPSFHSCAINNLGGYAATGHDYLLVNNTNYESVTLPFEMTAIDINDSGTWVVVGTEGLYYNGNYIYNVMNAGDFVSLKLDNTGDFICASSYSVYSYKYSTDSLIDNGPVSDNGYPVWCDIAGYKWIAVGNYGVLLWNYR
jgi:hypothetical protein